MLSVTANIFKVTLCKVSHLHWVALAYLEEVPALHVVLIECEGAQSSSYLMFLSNLHSIQCLRHSYSSCLHSINI